MTVDYKYQEFSKSGSWHSVTRDMDALAKKYKFTYEGDKLVERLVDREPLLENLWFTICKRVSDVMHEVIHELGDEFIFYWVDGIYMKHTPENVAKTMNIFISKGYQSKFKRINQIQFHEKGFTVNDYGDIKREFTYPNYSKKGNKVDYAENFKLAEFANNVVNNKIDLVDQIKKEFEDVDLEADETDDDDIETNVKSEKEDDGNKSE